MSFNEASKKSASLSMKLIVGNQKAYTTGDTIMGEVQLCVKRGKLSFKRLVLCVNCLGFCEDFTDYVMPVCHFKWKKILLDSGSDKMIVKGRGFHHIPFTFLLNNSSIGCPPVTTKFENFMGEISWEMIASTEVETSEGCMSQTAWAPRILTVFPLSKSDSTAVSYKGVQLNMFNYNIILHRLPQKLPQMPSTFSIRLSLTTTKSTAIRDIAIFLEREVCYLMTGVSRPETYLQLLGVKSLNQIVHKGRPVLLLYENCQIVPTHSAFKTSYIEVQYFLRLRICYGSTQDTMGSSEQRCAIELCPPDKRECVLQLIGETIL